MATTTNKTEAKPAVVLSEGTRSELAMNGHAVSPFTGALLVGSGTDDVRVVDEKEYLEVAREAAKRAPKKTVNRL